MAWIRVFVLIVVGVLLDAQPSLQTLWSKHDAIVLAVPHTPLKADPSWAHLIKGSRGQNVRGWDVGEPGTPTVLFWTGGPGDCVEPDMASWVGLDPKKFRFIAIDQPGVGDGVSEWVPNWLPEDTADDGESFLQSRGVKGPVVVVGWSWGSTMALVFAQRHPERVKALVVGGVWANSPEEVRRYLGPNGTRAIIPGMSQAFASVAPKLDTACDLHRAIKDGRGGTELAKAYGNAEMFQMRPDISLRIAPIEPLTATKGTPVDLATCKDPEVRFGFIESEMMCRAERGTWRLSMEFPQALSQVPLVVIQGRYDQVCDPEIALKVFQKWPGQKKRFVPLNIGHGSHLGVTKMELEQAGIDPNLEEKVNRALKLHFGGSGPMVGAAIQAISQ